MRNLRLLVNLSHSSKALANGLNFAVCTLDFTTNLFKRKGYVFILKEDELIRINPIDGANDCVASIKEFCPSNVTPISMIYNSILNTLIISFDKGDVLSISLADDLLPIENGMQCVGSIPSGIQCVSLSPDTETAAFLSGDNILILMSGNFDPLGETVLGSDQGEKEMVNVGWGRKETQFHGSEGKAAAKKKLIESSGNENTSVIDQKPNISWRGDSSMFAVNYWCSVKNYRKIKIFDKCGILQCTSEFLSGIQGTLSWRPSGNLISLSQKLPNKNVICFMEKNGLRHGDFTLPLNIQVLELSWNAESTILSGVCVDEATNQPCVLLWTTSNYHWYLKQRLDMSSAVVAFRWDDVVGNLTHILLADGSYLAYQWTWSVDHSAGLAHDDLSVVAVIDGNDVKLTAFQKCVVPPPMCGATVTTPSSVLQVMFAPFYAQNDKSPPPNDLCAYLSDGQLVFISGVEGSQQILNVVPVKWQSEAPTHPSPACLSHWLWLSLELLVCVLGSQSTSHLCVVQYDGQFATVTSTIPLDEPVLVVSQDPGSQRALIQLQSGTVLAYQDGGITPLSTLPEPCVALCSVGSHTFARAQNNHLYVDGELVADNVTSFFCLPKFLVMTLTSHQLCITAADSNFKVESEGGRRVERGALLVVAAGHSVILQMPRGNLETVQPRALTLVTAARLLDICDYKGVAQLLRRQRIDLNLCVDHNPSMFLLTVPRFVAQVRDPQWLSVFLAELSERDVTRTMYSMYYNKPTNRGQPLAKKVERVCSAVREAMTQTAEDRKHYLQPILSSLVREGRVGEAISLADTDQALSYLTLLLDTDRLYEEALADYNLDKALKIAGKSLKDPKEYVAYLNDLREMEPAYMKFTIDKRLRKPQSALRHLAQCADRMSECLQYVQDTGLYTIALQLFKDKPDVYQEVCLLYGEQLQRKHNYREAGLMYRRGGDVGKALAALTRAGCWRQCLTLAAEHNYSESALEELQQALYAALHAQQQHREAAHLSSQLGWHERTVSSLVEAHDWAAAVYTCHCHQLGHLIESAVKPALKECQTRTLADLKAKKEDLDKHSNRLTVVRQKKTALMNGTEFDAMSDIHSDTSSISSFSTSSAGTRTTKNTRKAQRKLWSLKEGNPREEQALLYTITELVQIVERLTGDVHNLCLALAELGLDEDASRLHEAMTAGLNHVELIRREVWPASVVKKTGSDAEAIDPTFIDQQLTHPPTSSVAPSWKLDIYT